MNPLNSLGLWLPVIMTAPSASRCTRREIKQRRRDHADIGDLASDVDQPFEQRIAQAGRAETAIAAEIDLAPALRRCSKVPSPRPRVRYVGLSEFGFGDAADVVFAEDSGLEHISILALPGGADARVYGAETHLGNGLLVQTRTRRDASRLLQQECLRHNDRYDVTRTG